MACSDCGSGFVKGKNDPPRSGVCSCAFDTHEDWMRWIQRCKECNECELPAHMCDYCANKR